MQSIILLSGSLGSGKTTVGKLLAARIPDGVHIESDVFYSFFSHRIAPHLPEADAQNKAAIAAACQAARSLHQSGYTVVLDGIFGPWNLSLISEQVNDRVVDVRYIILRTSLEEAIKRVRVRSGTSMDEVIATMHPQFENLGAWEGNVVDTTHLTPTLVVDRLIACLSTGMFRLSSSKVPRASA